MKRASLLFALCLSCAGVHGADDDPGTTIVGDRDSALGLVLAPWKDEAPAPEMDRPPAMRDATAAPLDAGAFARTTRYYATGRAYRSEKLQRNR